MLFKIDENLHPEFAEILRQHGHEAMTVYDQGLRGCSDTEIATVCRNEGRVLVTLDLDFADVRSFPPANYAGIVVLRPDQQTRTSTLGLLALILPLLDTEPIAGRLWIVDRSKVRFRG